MEALERLANVSPDEQRQAYRERRKRYYSTRDPREQELRAKEAELAAREAKIVELEEALEEREMRLHEKFVASVYLVDQGFDTNARLFIRDIKAAAAEHFGMTSDQIAGKSRTKQSAWARHVAMWLATRHTRASLPQIGKHFGGRDHTTVLHARDKMDRLWREEDERLVNDVMAIYYRLGVE